MRPTMQIVSKNVGWILSGGGISPAAATSGTQHRPLLSRELLHARAQDIYLFLPSNFLNYLGWKFSL